MGHDFQIHRPRRHTDCPETVEEIAERLEVPLSEPIFLVYMDLAQTEHIMSMAAEKAEDYSPRHMSEYAKLSTHRIKLVNQLDDLLEKEAARGRTWEPTFDTNSREYRIFKAAMTLVLEQKTAVDDGYDTLSSEEQSRFLQVLAESS